MSETPSTKQLAAQLYAEMDNVLGLGWRTRYATFDLAVAAGGEEIAAYCKAWRKQFAKRTERKLAAADRAAVRDAQDERQTETDPHVPVADKGAIGRYTSAERRDAIGAEGHVEDDDPQQRGAKYGFVEDSLYHPERFKYHDKPFIWNPVPPRELSAIHC